MPLGALEAEGSAREPRHHQIGVAGYPALLEVLLATCGVSCSESVVQVVHRVEPVVCTAVQLQELICKAFDVASALQLDVHQCHFLMWHVNDGSIHRGGKLLKLDFRDHGPDVFHG